MNGKSYNSTFSFSVTEFAYYNNKKNQLAVQPFEQTAKHKQGWHGGIFIKAGTFPLNFYPTGYGIPQH